MIILIWIGFFLSHGFPLLSYGIQPRTLTGMYGIAASPFLHANLSHLITNTTALLAFGLIFSLLEGKKTGSMLVSIIIIQGVLTWTLARPGIHIGASGLVFGLFAHLLFIGIFHRRFLYILISLSTAIVYGAMIFGIFPSEQGISWEAHLFGFIAGVLNARYR
ncbi:MAG: rhomboid family intramembrane serine protease [Oligoflexus sp.]